MKLGELLDARRVIVPLKARSVREATRQLAKALSSTGAVADDARLTEILKTEWPEDVVTVGGRAFLPHFRTPAVSRLSIALGVTETPLCLANDPNRCARVVVLVLAPTGAVAEYLRAMSAVAGALGNDDVLEKLHAAKTPDEVLSLTGLDETPVPPDVTVGDIMTSTVTSVGPDTTLADAAQLMLQRNVTAVPVAGESGEVLGLLTDGHLLRFLLPHTVSELGGGHMGARRRKSSRPKLEPEEAARMPVREVMDRSVLCLSEDQTVADVATLMQSKDVDRFPVTRDGALVGFLTRGDIVRKLLRT